MPSRQPGARRAVAVFVDEPRLGPRLSFWAAPEPPEGPMAPLSPLVTSDGLRLAVAAGGDDATVVVPNGAYFADDSGRRLERHRAGLRPAKPRRLRASARQARLARGVSTTWTTLKLRRRLGRDRIDLVAHSYVGVVAALSAAAHPDRVLRLVLLSPAPPDPAAVPLPPPDATRRAFRAPRGPSAGPARRRCRSAMPGVLGGAAGPLCRRSCAGPARRRLGPLRAAQRTRLHGRPDADVEPSLRRAAPPDADLARVTAPVLVVHGTADRSAPYAGGRAWARRLPNARLLTLDGACAVD